MLRTLGETLRVTMQRILNETRSVVHGFQVDLAPTGRCETLSLPQPLISLWMAVPKKRVESIEV